MAFPQLGNSDHIVSVSTNFPINSKQDAPFQCLDYDYSQADWDGLCDHSEMFHGRISLNSVLLLLLVIQVQVGIVVYIPHLKYQVKPHSSLSFSAACAAAIAHHSS